MKKEPVFLSVEDALVIHAGQIERYGGEAGLRDAGLLQSALGMPKVMFDGKFLHGSLPEMAAAHLSHVCQNHPFVDGNQRAGLALMLGFLGLNGLFLECSHAALYDLVMRTAQGKCSKAEIAVFVEEHVQPY